MKNDATNCRNTNYNRFKGTKTQKRESVRERSAVFTSDRVMNDQANSNDISKLILVKK